MEGARNTARGRGRARRVAEPDTAYTDLTPEQALKHIATLEKKMYQHARDLEFEQAAQIRDEIDGLRRDGLGLPNVRAG